MTVGADGIPFVFLLPYNVHVFVLHISLDMAKVCNQHDIFFSE